MASGTKEKILESALHMFSEKGYAGTNMRELAQSLGLTKSALYKHFNSKEDIWNAILDEAEELYNANFASAVNLPEIPESTDKLTEIAMQLVDFTVHNEKISTIRKMLMTEQFRDKRICRLATEHFLTRLENVFAGIFREMIIINILSDDNPEMMALSFTTPITALIHLIDREPEKEAEALERIRAFIDHFINIYKFR